MNLRNKVQILSLIAIQILITVLSYSLLTYNLSIIDANRNRLDLVGQLDIISNRIYINLNEFLNGNTQYDPITSLNEFENYAGIIKNGGQFYSVYISELPDDLSHEHEILNNRFSKYKNHQLMHKFIVTTGKWKLSLSI